MSEVIMSKIGLGTWKLGGDVVANPNNDDLRDIDAILYAIKHGINHIDTSESYSDGKSEKIVGNAIKKINRKDIFLATKVREWNLRYNDLISACYKSLERLQVDYIDLYYIHKQNSNVPIQETCNALNYLINQGVIKNVGLSNVEISTIEKFNKYLIKKIYAVQNQYNLVCRESQVKNIVNYCKINDIKFVCWRPILLSYPHVGDPMYHKGTYPLLDNIAEKYGVSNVQIVAKWLLQQENVYIIFKSNQVRHIKEIIDTNSFELSEDDWQELNINFPVKFNKGCTADEFYELS